MAQLKPQTAEQRRTATLFAVLIAADFLIVMALCWWGISLYSRDGFGPFLAVMIPTSIFALLTAVPLGVRWRRLAADIRVTQTNG
jgi:hypothetical protein